MPKLNDIPQFTPSATWSVDIQWAQLEPWLTEQIRQGLDLDPDFQRGHVWTETQQIRYIEFILRGGRTGKDILTNHPRWHAGMSGSYVLVDGKQRIEAIRRFMRNDLAAFGYRFEEYTDRDRMRTKLGLKWHVNELQSRAEVLQWYIDLNSGGTVHADEEIERVKQLLAREHA